jgi:hypothetical protein
LQGLLFAWHSRPVFYQPSPTASVFGDCQARRGVAWGDWSHFLVYTAKLNWFLPVAFIPALGVTATFAKATLALLLLIDAWPRNTALATAALLLVFALAMTFALGIKAPLGYSVHVGATAAFYLAVTSPIRPGVVTDARFDGQQFL